MKLIVVSNFSDVPNEHYLLNLLFCEGLQYFHLRKSGYTASRMAAYIERIPEPFRRYVVLHSHFELVERYGLRGAHFTKKYCYEDFLRDRGQDPTPPRKQFFAHLSFSLHSIQEVKKASPMFDYLFLSPIFDSISNRGYNSKFRINDLKVFLGEKPDRPNVIALGGITDHVVDQAFDAGFDGLALLGHLWTTFEHDRDLVQAVKRFRAIQQRIETRSAARREETPALTQN